MMANIDGAVSETKCTYDVFLSFRGEDTRHTFTCFLYDALRRKGIITFMDDGELQFGDEIGPTLLKAIGESRISIVVFSENYAASSWCLDELVRIHECMTMKPKNQLVYPIFYKVNPSDVRYQNGSYGKAMTKHESRFGKNSERMQKWKSALSHIANLKGQHFKLEEGRDESKFIDDLVSTIFIKVSPKDLSSDEHVVGREYLVNELKSLLDLESRNITCLLGIHGTGGIGKTTLAKALYDSIYKQFEGSTFLFNVRETSKQINGLELLQQRLLSKTLAVEDSKFQLESKEEGTRTIKSRLGLKRVLIVLDDVDNIEQLNSFAGGRDWFGLGSRIIITTRDKHLLDLGGIKKRYEVRLLNNQESLELFCQSAFKKTCPESSYEDLSNRAMQCCKGLPLALKVLGSHMVGKDLGGWKDALVRYEKNPHPDVQTVLRISYNSLPRNEKNIFLDVACFFKGQRLEYVKRVLDACDFSSGDGITTLVNRSLLTVDYHSLGMHDLIQDMGREIVKEEADNKVGKCSRLWFHKDVLKVLADNNGSSKIQGIMLDPPQREEVNCIDTVFEKMKNLRILIVRNTSFSHEPRYLPNNLRLLEWKNYPSQSFPSGFYPRDIGGFNLRGSPLLVLEKPFQRFKHLTFMNISYCDMVTKFPDVYGAKNLRELRLDGCKKLVSIHESVGLLTDLVFLSASECTQLESFVPTINLPSLQYLTFNFCRRLAHFPEIGGTMDQPLEINMLDTAIKELPETVKVLTGLNYLEMTGCMELQHLPSSLFTLPNFVTLKIGGCRQLRESFRRFERSHSACPKLETLHFDTADLSDEDVHAIIYNFPNLKHLNVAWSLFESLPARIIESTNLTSLDVRYCVKLQEIPELPSSVQKVDARHCKSLSSETSNILWSQVRREMKRLEVMMPKREIPEWFDYVNKAGFPVFEARGKFPMVALAFVFGEVNANANRSSLEMPAHWRAVGMHLLIDGEHTRYHNFVVAENHALLCDLRVLFNLQEWEDAGVGISNDWKTIQVYCETELSLCSWGVCVYKHETNMEDIQFASQDSSSSLVPSLGAISEEEKVKNQKQSLNLPEMYRALHMQIRTLDELGHFVGKPPEFLETSQMLLRMLEKASRSVMAPREGEGSSGFNIEEEEDKEVNLLSQFFAKITSDDGGKTQEAGPSSQQQQLFAKITSDDGGKTQEAGSSNQQRHLFAKITSDDGGKTQEAGPSSQQQRYAQELEEEDSSSECGSGKGSEDVEDTYDLDHNIAQPETHTADSTCLAIFPILKKLLCFFCLFCLFVKCVKRLKDWELTCPGFHFKLEKKIKKVLNKLL